MRKYVTAATLSFLFVGQAVALDGRAYEGTWSGQFKDGTPVVLSIPAGIANGEPASYSYNNQDQGPQTPTVQKNKIRLDNPSGTYIIIGPVKGGRLPYFWTNGTKQASTVLMKN